MSESDFLSIESQFFKLTHELKEFKGNIVYVGGWLPYLYTKYLWKNKKYEPVFTTDIDIGLRCFGGHKKTIESVLLENQYYSKPSNYKNQMMYYIGTDKRNIRLDFLSAERKDQEIQKIAGDNIYVCNSLYQFKILMDPENTFELKCNNHSIVVPYPGAYVFHKGITFKIRASEEDSAKSKIDKDLWSIFYVTVNIPDDSKADFYDMLHKLDTQMDGDFLNNIKESFFSKNSKGINSIFSFYKDYGINFKNHIVEVMKELKLELGNRRKIRIS